MTRYGLFCLCGCLYAVGLTRRTGEPLLDYLALALGGCVGGFLLMELVLDALLRERPAADPRPGQQFTLFAHHGVFTMVRVLESGNILLVGDNTGEVTVACPFDLTPCAMSNNV